MPDIDLAFAGAIFNNSFPLQTILTRDIYGNPRPSQSCLGAVQFAQTFSPLVGGNTYFINGSQNPPTLALPTVGTFATINKAIQYINANGVDGFGGGSQPINLIITSGYQGEGDTIITALLDYPRMNINRTITLKPDLTYSTIVKDTVPLTGTYSVQNSNNKLYLITIGKNDYGKTCIEEICDTSFVLNFKEDAVSLGESVYQKLIF
jgi:hypothetical protein